jgi:hypothetical protein
MAAARPSGVEFRNCVIWNLRLRGTEEVSERSLKNYKLQIEIDRDERIANPVNRSLEEKEVGTL